jgi:hypothetical protein
MDGRCACWTVVADLRSITVRSKPTFCRLPDRSSGRASERSHGFAARSRHDDFGARKAHLGTALALNSPQPRARAVSPGAHGPTRPCTGSATRQRADGEYGAWRKSASPIGETSQARAAEMLNVGKRTVGRAAMMASSARKKGPPAFGGPSLGRNVLRSKTPLEPVTSKNGKRLFPAVFTQKENGCGIVSSEPRR